MTTPHVPPTDVEIDNALIVFPSKASMFIFAQEIKNLRAELQQLKAAPSTELDTIAELLRQCLNKSIHQNPFEGNKLLAAIHKTEAFISLSKLKSTPRGLGLDRETLAKTIHKVLDFKPNVWEVSQFKDSYYLAADAVLALVAQATVSAGEFLPQIRIQQMSNNNFNRDAAVERAKAATEVTDRKIYDHGGGRAWRRAKLESDDLIIDTYNASDTAFYQNAREDVLAIDALLDEAVKLIEIISDDDGIYNNYEQGLTRRMARAFLAKVKK